MLTNKFSLAFTIGLGDMSAFTTSSAGISWVNKDYRDTSKLCLISDKFSQFVKTPFSKLFSLLFSNRYLKPFQVFKGNTPVGVFSERYNLFGNSVVSILFKSPFFAREFFKMSLGRLRTSFLQGLFKFGHTFTNIINLFARKGITVAMHHYR